MTIKVKVGEAKTHLSELLSKVESGEEVIIQRSNEPIARLTAIASRKKISATIADIRRNREGTASLEDILEWRDEGRR